MNEDYNVKGEYIFRGIEYLITMKTLKNGTCLCVEVEDKITGDQWKGSFDSSYIEDLTHKTGNFKQFDVFVSMLESALEKSSDSVLLDLLTFGDLELLRNRKAGGAGNRLNNKTRATKQQENKRYLILVYSVEFDRIHYPLPLLFQGKPDPIHLQNLVKQLNDEIIRLKQSRNENYGSDDFHRLKSEFDDLLQEKIEIENAYDQLKNKSRNRHSISKEVIVLKKVVQNLEMEMLREKTKFQKQLAKRSAEVKRLTIELKELSSTERTLQIRVKSLTNELAIYKRSRTPITNGRQSSMSTHNTSYRNNPQRSNSRTRPGTGHQRSLSRGSNSGSFYQRSRSRSQECRSSAQNRNRSLSRDKRNYPTGAGYKSRTPTPNRQARFNPTLYNEERKRKLQESQERLKRRTSSGFIPKSNESRGRSRTRIIDRDHFSSSRERYNVGLRKRNSSLESRNSSDNGSISRTKNVRAWRKSPKYSSNRRLSSTPVMERKKSHKRTVTNDTDIDEIDARLEALQKYMRDIK